MIRIIVAHGQEALHPFIKNLTTMLYEKGVDYFVDTHYSRRMSDRIFFPASDFQFIIGSREAEEDTVCIRKYDQVIHRGLPILELPEFLMNNNLIGII